MRFYNLFLVGLFMLACSYASAQQKVTFATHPTISPNADYVVFSFEGDLWKVDAAGGQALRLTAMSGEEINPRISPDGKWLAFSSNQNGNLDVYVMPIDGGEIKQLTFHDGQDYVDSWSWDSKEIYFTSSRYNRFTSFKVSLNGETPERIFSHYFNTIHQVTETPSGDLLFNNSWESFTSANRKRYKGAFNPDILSYNPKTKEYKQLTTYEGKDFWQTVDRHGNLYFVSDRNNGEYNLYQYANGNSKALTKFNTSIKRPHVAANGEAIVFEKDYRIFVYNVKSGKVTEPTIHLARNSVLDKMKSFSIAGRISYMDVSPDGKKVALVSRGELFVGDIEGKFIRQMPSTGERVMEVKWLKDNKTLLFNQTQKGFLNLYTRAADGTGEVKPLTNDERSNRDLSLSPEHDKAVYLSGRDQVRILDLNTLKSSTVVNDEIWGFQNSKPSFSPDGKYILYTAYRNFEEDIFVYDLKEGRSVNLTQTGVSEKSPVWSPDGKYLYFASNRTEPSYPRGMRNASVYRMALDEFDSPYRQEKFDELFAEVDTTKDKNKKDAKSEKIEVSINYSGLRDRITRESPSFGSQVNPIAFQHNDSEILFYGSNQGEGKMALYRRVRKPFTPDKNEKVVDGFLGNLVQVKGKFYGLQQGAIFSYNPNNNQVSKITTDYSFNRNLQQEFEQMFYETWAGIQENFYDESFHGVDWNKVKAQYSAYLPHINSRSDLRVLLNDMLGELNSSHLGFNSQGAEEQKAFVARTQEIGVEFQQDNPFEIKSIIPKGPATKKGVDLRVGDIIVAVNGKKVEAGVNRNQYFTSPTLDNELVLTVRRGGTEVETRIRPISSGVFKELLYDQWIADNRAKVDELSDNKIAYVYMKNMGEGELENFYLDMAAYENQKQGVILDLRYNTGGNVHDDVLKFLSQRPYLQWKYREGKKSPQGHFAPSGKPIVLLINQQSLSDAEMTSAGFKELGLGKIIGTETYRWIIFTSAKGLVDGSSYRVPAWGCYTLDGDNLELTGVSPDISVDNTFVDLLEDKDPQLERAVQEILSDL